MPKTKTNSDSDSSDFTPRRSTRHLAKMNSSVSTIEMPPPSSTVSKHRRKFARSEAFDFDERNVSKSDSDGNTEIPQSNGKYVLVRNKNDRAEDEVKETLPQGNISGVEILTDDESESEDIGAVDVVSQAKPVVNPIVIVDLSESLPESAEEPERVLNVTFSPKEQKMTLPSTSASASRGPAPKISSLKRLQATPKPFISDKNGRLSSRNGTPYLRKVNHGNMATIANTKSFSENKKKKILESARSLQSKKSVAFTTPMTDKKGQKEEEPLANVSTLPKTLKPVSMKDAILNKKARKAAAKMQANSGSANAPMARSASKTPVPNFNSIHEKMFSKMESIVETVARRNERAKALAFGSAKKEKNGPSANKKPVELPAEPRQPPTNVQERLPLVFSTHGKPTVKFPSGAANVQGRNDQKVFQFAAVKPSVKLAIEPVRKPLTANLQKRNERHREMFKKSKMPREAAERVQIQGVRLNRRFELLMKNRKQA